MDTGETITLSELAPRQAVMIPITEQWPRRALAGMSRIRSGGMRRRHPCGTPAYLKSAGVLKTKAHTRGRLAGAGGIDPRTRLKGIRKPTETEGTDHE